MAPAWELRLLRWCSLARDRSRDKREYTAPDQGMACQVPLAKSWSWVVMARDSTSLRLEVHRLDNRPPLFNFALLEGSESCRGLLSECGNLLAQVGQPLLHSFVGQCITNRRIALGGDIMRRTSGRPRAGPTSDVESRQSCLVHRGDVGCGCEARLGGNGIRVDVAVTHMRQGARRLVEHQVHMPTHQILHGRGRTAVLRELKCRAGRTLEVRSTDM